MARIWQWLSEELDPYGVNHSSGNAQSVTLSSTIQHLVHDVKNHLEHGLRNKPELKDQVLERCSVNVGDSCLNYSWIPLICEMATNLNTTLWLSGYRWYVLNEIKDGRILKTGGWYTYEPSTQQQNGRVVLDFGPARANQANAALAITTLAGYISMAFNLLDFYYACLGGSGKAAARMAIVLLKYSEQPEPSAQDTPELECVRQYPYWLRRKTYEHLDHLNQLKAIPADWMMRFRHLLLWRDGDPDDWNA